MSQRGLLPKGEASAKGVSTPLALCRRHFLQVGIAAQRSALGTRPSQWLPMSDWQTLKGLKGKG
ncbi:hypothetical protein I8751_09105 [Nostocaceae cyanobacterium CENA357]|uniref:Uncharacterized protein n=1 Tax=Atlanticothrix silvestris CENA357 TaxID=1725252 RepID=A0A8J7HHA6_9CYAN|nr:hypothetical protein [Atlanticothrix silvestris]MBH8552531.1 hypothetical protein [Atlanticothrix silvestris CENA357]